MAPRPFLALPAEIRLRIYNFVLGQIPLSAPLISYSGLLYSCRLVRQELEPEILQSMADFLLDVRRRCRQVYPEDMEFDAPQTLGELYNLRVSRPLKFKMFSRDDPFMALLYMHFNVLTISSQDPSSELIDRDVERWTQGNMATLCYWITSRGNGAPEPPAKRIIYDWATFRQNGSTARLYSCQQAIKKRDTWAAVFLRHWDDSTFEGVAFMRSGSEIREEETGEIFRVRNMGYCYMKDGAVESYRHIDKIW